jgi:hypothetical protein
MNSLVVLAQQSAQGGSPMMTLAWLTIFAVASAVFCWKVFEKAGQPAWAAIVPIYNLAVLCKVARRPAWWAILCLIPVVNVVALAMVSFDIAKSFGKGTGFGVGLWLFGPIFYPVLGYGPAQYQPGAPASANQQDMRAAA